MGTTDNGWLAPPQATRPLVVDGVEFVPGIVDDDDVHTVFTYLMEQYADRVEPLVRGWCWGYAYRDNANDPYALSRHSGGIAIDANAPRHPNGVPAYQTFTAAQIGTIRAILAELDGAVRWGGDYNGTPDAMHFEIDTTPQRLAVTAARIRSGDDMALSDDLFPNDTAKNVTVGDALRDVLVTGDRVKRLEERLNAFIAGEKQRDARTREQLTDLLADVDALPDTALTKAQVRALFQQYLGDPPA